MDITSTIHEDKQKHWYERSANLVLPSFTPIMNNWSEKCSMWQDSVSPKNGKTGCPLFSRDVVWKANKYVLWIINNAINQCIEKTVKLRKLEYSCYHEGSLLPTFFPYLQYFFLHLHFHYHFLSQYGNQTDARIKRTLRSRALFSELYITWVGTLRNILIFKSTLLPFYLYLILS